MLDFDMTLPTEKGEKDEIMKPFARNVGQSLVIGSKQPLYGAVEAFHSKLTDDRIQRTRLPCIVEQK